MRRIWLVFWHEYWHHLTRKGYLIFTFGFPLTLIGVPFIGGSILALAIYWAAPKIDSRPVGVVDEVNLLLSPAEEMIVDETGYVVQSDLQTFLGDTDAESELQSRLSSPIKVIFFRTPQEAAAALATDYIQAYYTIPATYWETGEVIVTYYKAPNRAIHSMVEGWIQLTINQQVPEPLLRRFYRGPAISHTDLTGQARDFSFINFIEGAIVYMIIYFVRLVGTSFTANYMFDSIANESDDRTLEILVTSVTPLQFLLGKLFGLLAIGLTQLGMWACLGLIVLQLSHLLLGVNLLAFLLDWPYLGVLVSMLLGAYVMDHILAAALGLLKVSGGAGMQLFGLINMASGFGLLYATYFIPRNPHTPLAIFTSLLPITSPIVLMIRIVVSQVPQWQIILAQILLWTTNILALIWLRRLLQANLVAYRPPFRLRAWLKARFKSVVSPVSLAIRRRLSNEQ